MRQECVKATRARRKNGPWGLLKWIAASLSAVAICMASPSSTFADQAENEARRGVELYFQKDFDMATEAFSKAAEMAPTSANIQYNLGTALARKGEFAKAEEALERSLIPRESLHSPSYALYNLGHSQVSGAMADADGPVAADPSQKMEALKKGLESFRGALIADPKDVEAKHNYEVTRELIRRLEQQQQKQQQEQNQEQKQDDQKKDENDQDQNKQDQNQQKKDDQNEDQQNQDQQENQEQQDEQDEGKEEENKKDQKNEQDQQNQSNNPQGGQGQQKGEPEFSPRELDARRVLNSLEKEKPEQFKQLFKMQSLGKPRRLERDW